MSRIKRCLCCNKLKRRELYAKGNVCDECVKAIFKPTVPQGTQIEGVQLLIDFE